MFSAIAKMAVPNPKAVPRPKYDSINPKPTASKDMKKYIGRVSVSYDEEKLVMVPTVPMYENLPANPYAKSIPICRARIRKPRSVSFLDRGIENG